MFSTLSGHGNWAKFVAFDSNDILVSGSGDSTIKLWKKNTGSLLRTLSGLRILLFRENLFQ
jgi:WD40 repeat protein